MNCRVLIKSFAWVVAILFSAKIAEAKVEAQTQIRQYNDGDTKVTSPSVEVSGTFDRETTKISAEYTSDLLTSASADVRAFSSKGVIEDKRDEYSTNIERQIPDGTMGIGYVQSTEKDYQSKIISASGTRDLFTKNTTFGFNFSSGQDRILSMSNSAFDESMNHQNYSLSVSQVLSKQSLAQLNYEFRIENGFLASPYRKAKINNGGIIQTVGENHPRTLNRNAVALKYNYYFKDIGLALASSYRFYFDSWAVQSHTVEERLTKTFNDHWLGSLSLRYYQQKKAIFYQDYYGTDPGPFYTGNNTLATFSGYMVGLRPTYKFNEDYEVFAKYEYFAQTFTDASDAGQISTLSDDKQLTVQATVIGLGLIARF